MTVQSLASHITQNLPDDANSAALLATCGYMASLILASVEDDELRAEASARFVAALQAALVAAEEMRTH